MESQVRERAAFPLATSLDRGIVEHPVLSPHLSAHYVEDYALISSEIGQYTLSGQRYLDILPLLDGRSRHAVAAALAARHSPLEVQAALVSLATRGYIVSAEHDLDPGQAAFWCMLGATPRYAETRLREVCVEVAGEGAAQNRVVAELVRMGVSVSREADVVSRKANGESRETIAEPADGAALTIFVTGDYLDERHAETNRRRFQSGPPWLLVNPTGMVPYFGPVFRPGEFCWACLAHRIAANSEVDSFLRQAPGAVRAPQALAAAPPLDDAVCGLAAMETAKWLVTGASAIEDHVVSFEGFALERQLHPVMRRPQCFVCGSRSLHDPERAATPVRLRAQPSPLSNSGGLRSVPPAETLRAYRRLISPISGVVTELVRTTDESDSWMHVYRAGSNLALMNGRLSVLRTSLRSKSSGKGASREQAEASALCEAIERYSGVFHGDEIRRSACFEDFADGEAIHPNDIQLFSRWQLDNADAINAQGTRFNHIPVAFDPSVRMDWSPVWSLTDDRCRWLPTQMLYYAKPLENGVVHCPPDSNGCAAGNTLEEAILQGFFELAERDAFACWWYNRLSLPEMEIDSFKDEYFQRAREYYAALNRDVWLLDLTNDLGIPVFAGVSARTDKPAEDILFSAGAHRDPRIAAYRALCELNQYLDAVRDVKVDGSGYRYDDPECLRWWTTETLATQPWLKPSSAPPRRMSDYPDPGNADVRDEVEACRALVEAHGMEFLVLDQSRPDVGMPVAKTIVPGLRHFWPRNAPGRLYDVPVAMGWRRTPIAEGDLNPIGVFI